MKVIIMKQRICKNVKIIGIFAVLLGASFFSTVNAIPDSNTYRNIQNEIMPYPTISDGTEYWALLVAVGDYADNPGEDRPLMLEEVDDLYDLFIESPWWSEDHIKVIKGEEATITNIIKGLRWLDRMEDSDDISVVYITTHGFPLDVDIPPRDEADGFDEALVSYWGFTYPSLFLWDDELNVLLNRLESQGVCFIVDSCFAGGFNDPPDWNMSGIGHENQVTADQWVQGFGEDVRGQGRVVLMASREDEVSYSGGFAPYLIDGLRGFGDSNMDGIITAEEAFFYAEPRTSYRQHPTMFDGYDGDLPLIQLSSTIQNDETSEQMKKSDMQRSEQLIFGDYADETALVCGYIKDEENMDPIENAYVSVRGHDNQWEFYENETTTDEFGYYEMNIPPGRFRVSAYADEYLSAGSGPFEIDEYETRWINLSLGLRPEETSVICGYITDDETSDPIEGAAVDLLWFENEYQYYQNETVSDPFGFYLMNVAPGYIDIDVEASGYFHENFDDIYIDDDETIWLNVTLYPRPQENAIISGYVNDELTGAPLYNARVSLYWIDIELDHGYENRTYADSEGFFTINIAAGEVYHDIRMDGYDYYNPYRLDITDYETLWFNVTLEEEIIEVDLTKPLNALYINDERIVPFPKARIIGSITIEAEIEDSWHGPSEAEKVEFYIDGVLKATDTSEPYNWTWDQKTFGRHIIKVVAYDFEGHSVSKEREVYKLF